MHVLVSREPAVVLRLVSVQVVEDDMDLAIGAVGNDFVHELKELATSPPFEVSGLHLARGDFQGGKEGGGAVAFVVVAAAHEGLAVGKPQPALRALQCLNMGLLVHAQHQGILRRIQVQSDDVGGLPGEFRICADAPGPPPLQVNPVKAQDLPDVVGTHIAQVTRQERPGPDAVALRRRLIQCLQDAPLGPRIIPHRLARTRRIAKPFQTIHGKAPAPLAYARRSRLHFPRHRHAGRARAQPQDHPSALAHAALRLARTRPRLQHGPLLGTQNDRRRFRHFIASLGPVWHFNGGDYTYYAN